MSEPKKVIYPEWAEWKAIDSDGLLWAFESEPLLNDRWHYAISGRAAVIQTGLPTEGWETSLERINKEVMSDKLSYDQLEKRCKLLEAALSFLIKVKDHKDKYGKDIWYQDAQPMAWDQARIAVSTH